MAGEIRNFVNQKANRKKAESLSRIPEELDRCPRCDAAVASSASDSPGWLEKTVLRLLGRRPDPCPTCADGFCIPGRRPLNEGSREAQAFEFLPPGDGDGFAEVIDEIRRAERRMDAVDGFGATSRQV